MDTNLLPEKAPSQEDIPSALPESQGVTQGVPEITQNAVPSLQPEEPPITSVPAPLGQNSDAIEQEIEDATMQEIPADFNADDIAADTPVLPEPEAPVLNGLNEAADDHHEQEAEANSSVSNIPALRSFATPLKLLPPLKDIESITTPKSFGVAKDATFKSSPVQMHNSMQLGDLAEADEDAFDGTANDTFAHAAGAPQHSTQSNNAKSAEIEAAAAFLEVEPQTLLSGGNDFVAKVAQRAQKFLGLQSELSFFKLNQEQVNQVQLKKYEQLQRKLEKIHETNKSLLEENEAGALQLAQSNDAILDLRKTNSALLAKIQELESSIHESKNGTSNREHEIALLNESVNALTRSNAEQGQRISELTRELNESTNENFSFKLELSKKTNELSYTKNQKDWYESQLKSVQDKYTDLIKRYDSESLKDSNQISSLKTTNETLAALKDSLLGQVKTLREKYEELSASKSDLETKFEVQNSRFAKEASLKSEAIELLNIQLQEKNDRIVQLESYADDLKSSSADSVEALQRKLIEKEDHIDQVEERLRRAEEALDSELHKETKLPKLAPSAELILHEGNLGISLSALYTEFNTVKKQLIVEKSQKEKLAAEVQHFIAQLDARKPAIANYRNRIQYYEETLKDVLSKMESIRVEKTESEKECNRLRTRLASYEIEIQSIKQLSKDLGRQLCFYLIHSKIREGNEDPLSSHEKKVIDQILAKSGNKNAHEESDTDQLITERLIGFASIIDLQKRNEELTVAIRLLGKQLEEKDTEPNGFEAAAVEEAKEAILTLQSELDSITLKYDAVSKERDLIKSLNEGSLSSDDNKSEFRLLQETCDDLRVKVQDGEKLLKSIQSQSEAKIRSLNDTILESKATIEELKERVSTAKHSVELSESRLENSKKLLENARNEIENSHKETAFWKNQSSRQEDLLVKKSNELRDAERSLLASVSVHHSLQTEKEVWTSSHASLVDEIQHLKADKDQLNSFVFNLQSLLKEREASSAKLSKKLIESVENYQLLQEKITEKEERILILSSQSDMALRAQNAKLEQVNELSQKLLEARSKITEKQAVIDNLKKDLASGGNKLSLTRKVVPSHSSADDNSPILATEYNDLKDALKVAEAQVSEFSFIAKSAENALMSATESFDEFKEATNAKLSAIEEEKLSLLKESELLKKAIEDLQNQLHEHDLQTSSQIKDLQMKLQESSLKAESYDQMKVDYEKKLSSISQDLSNQISLSDDLQKRYETKVVEAEQLNAELAQQKQRNSDYIVEVDSLTSKLEKTEADLLVKEERLNEYLSGQQEDLQSTQIKLKDLQYQYDLALTQLELQKPFSESEDPQTSDNYRQVINYLRAEKESAESKASMASDEVTQLKVQLDGITAELKASKSQLSRLNSMKMELEDSNKDHARLVEQLEQLNILRESNSTLRIENQNCLEKINELQAKIDVLATTVPSNDVGVQAEVQDQELKLLREENERLKNQPNNTEELEKLRQRFEKVKSEFLTKLTNHRAKNKELERQLLEVKLQLESSQEELTKSKSSPTNSEKESSLAAQLKRAEDEKNEVEKKFTNEVSKLKSAYEKQKAEANAGFESRLAEAKSNSSAPAGSSEAQVKEKLEAEWKQKLDKVTSDLKANFERDLSKIVEQRVQERLLKIKQDDPKLNFNDVQTRLEKEYEAKINALNQSFEKKLAEQKASTEKAVSTKYEFKLKVLNRKVEKFEKEKGASLPLKPNANVNGGNTLQVKPTHQVANIQENLPLGPQASQRISNPVHPKTTEPPVEKGKSANSETTDGNAGKKRPLSQGNPPSITFKRTKD